VWIVAKRIMLGNTDLVADVVTVAVIIGTNNFQKIKAAEKSVAFILGLKAEKSGILIQWKSCVRFIGIYENSMIYYP
jgi:hypothetical protein